MTAITPPRRPFSWRRIPLYVLLLIAAAFYLMPVYVLLITGFKSQVEALNIFNMWTPPDILSFHAFNVAWFGAARVTESNRRSATSSPTPWCRLSCRRPSR